MNLVSLQNFNKISILNNSYSTTISTSLLQYYLYNYHYYLYFPLSSIIAYKLSRKYFINHIVINLLKSLTQYVFIYIKSKKSVKHVCNKNKIELTHLKKNNENIENNNTNKIEEDKETKEANENMNNNENKNESNLYYYLSYFNPYSYNIYKTQQIHNNVIENEIIKNNSEKSVNSHHIHFDNIIDNENTNNKNSECNRESSYFNKFFNIFSYKKREINKSYSDYSIETHVDLCQKCSENDISNTINDKTEKCNECNNNGNKIYILKKYNKEYNK